MEIRHYTPADAAEWNAFVATAKNGTFLFNRNYMDYHSDRFRDHSLMVHDASGRLAAVFPANIDGDTVYSHQGLTYGGLVMDNKTSGAGENSPLNILTLISETLRGEGVKTLFYKAVPHIYHRQPAEEDLYALWRMGARLDIRNLSTTINLADPIKSSRLGKRAVKRRNRFNITVEPTDDASLFWPIIVEDRRVRHNVKPVHNQQEIQLLRDRFPEDIKFFIARRESEILAGAVIYNINGVMHLQYAAASDLGKEQYAVDVIYNQLLEDTPARQFDFGISNEDRGLYLNAGMVAHKEEFGGRSVVYDTYRLDL